MNATCNWLLKKGAKLFENYTTTIVFWANELIIMQSWFNLYTLYLE